MRVSPKGSRLPHLAGKGSVDYKAIDQDSSVIGLSSKFLKPVRTANVYAEDTSWSPFGGEFHGYVRDVTA